MGGRTSSVHPHISTHSDSQFVKAMRINRAGRVQVETFLSQTKALMIVRLGDIFL